MRFKSQPTGGFHVFAVAGVNTVSFGIKATTAAKKDLLGFGVERADLEEKYVMPGFKVFESVIPHPTDETRVSTMDHPVQSFVWDDFTAKAGHKYEYTFQPIKGVPKNLDRSATPIKIKIRTEPLFSSLENDVFFNRGVASSQAYATRFSNTKPDELPSKEEKEKALEWLSRKLDDALLLFISSTKKGDALRCCFYEFHYKPVLQELKKAITRKVDVMIIVDGKVNEFTDKKGKKHPSFPRKDNMDAIKDAGIPKKNVIFREAKPTNIQHNKFMVRLKGASQAPAEVWTGSTNISLGGIHGQTNVGHWIRNKAVAKKFLEYWKILSKDPGSKKGDDRSKARKRNDAFKVDVEALNVVPETLDDVANGVTPVFSPRSGLTILDLYFDLVDTAERSAFITLAFGINATLKKKLENNTSDNHIVFLLLEKEDKPKKNSKTPFLAINSRNNVYKAWGSYIRDPLYQWARETNARALEFNHHVVYIHSKFLLRDPLGEDPIVVTGSANFSAASTNSNDENMLVIRGDQRAADIYFTEFNRLFNHYYFRSVHEAASRRNPPTGAADSSLFLAEDHEWTSKYAPGKLRQKRLDLYVNMRGYAP